MNILNYYFPQKIRFPDTPFNKNISLTRYPHSSILLVDGLVESGDIMTKIWHKGLSSLLPHNFQPQKVLLLGLAGGCNAKLINSFFPKAQITAVEIDPAMVEIGQKYFDLGKIRNLNIITADAQAFVDNLSVKDKFDLVLVDCFVGVHIPHKLENLDFFKKLKEHCRYVLINRLWWKVERETSLSFLRSLATRFLFVKVHTSTNALISLV